MTEIPDDVVELAAEEYAKMQGWPTDYAVTDGWRERRHSTMRHVLSLPEVRAALAPSPVPVVSQAERLAAKRQDWLFQWGSGCGWIGLTDKCKAEHVAAFQALIDDGTIPPEPVPRTDAEVLADLVALSDTGQVQIHMTHFDEGLPVYEVSWRKPGWSPPPHGPDIAAAHHSLGWPVARVLEMAQPHIDPTPPPLGTEKGGE